MIQHTRSNSLLVDCLNLLILSAFAVAQPVFDLLSRNPEFFTSRHSKFSDAILLASVVCVLLPGVIVCLRLMAGWISKRAGSFVQSFFLTIFIALLILPLLKRTGSFSGVIIAIGSLLLGGVVAVLYRRSKIVRNNLIFLFPALIVVPAIFLHSTHQNLSTAVDHRPLVRVHSNTPVILVIFDELPLVSLLDENRAIDAVRYPNFAALRKDFTWFQNATTVSTQTGFAVPAILTGNYPHSGKVAPTAKNYPNNLFALLQRSHELKVTEVVTMLAPDSVRSAPAFSQRNLSLLADAVAVYLQIVLPDDMTGHLPSVSHQWSNFWEPAPNQLSLQEIRPDLPLLNSLSSIKRSSKPLLYYCHVNLPHNPYSYLPSGRRYDWVGFGPSGLEGLQPNDTWTKDESIVNVVYQRHLLQVGYADRLLGKVLASANAAGLYDSALIVITSDHGACFAPGQSFRQPTRSNYGDVMLVPLFVKLPNQKNGAVVDRPVQSIDIVPTIASVVGVSPLPHTDGRYLFDPSSGRPNVLIQVNSLARKLSLFGSNTEEVLFRFGPYSRYVDRPLQDFVIEGNTTNVSAQIKRGPFDLVDTNSSVLPCFIRGWLSFSDNSNRHLDIAIVMNGILRATARSSQITAFLMHRRVEAFEAVLPENSFRNGKNQLQIFVIKGEQKQKLVLQPIEVKM